MKKQDIRVYDENNLAHGYWVGYYPNGKLCFNGYLIHGKRHGYWVRYHDNGKLYSKGCYIHGKKHGYWEVYFSNGKLEYKGYCYLGTKVHRTPNNKSLK